MQFFKKYLILSLFTTGLLGTVINGCAQSAGEVDLLRSINPTNPNNPIFKGLSSTDKPIAVGIPLGILAIGLLQHQTNAEINGVEMLAGLGFTTVATTALKAIVKRPRPYVTYSGIYPDSIDDSYSFPSGHTSIAFSTATSLALIYKKWYITIPAYAWATGVGYSRMYLGQHYPSDVLAGAATGAASAYISHWLNKKFFFRKKK
jgi:undecaprenyl-diphosphatase